MHLQREAAGSSVAELAPSAALSQARMWSVAVFFYCWQWLNEELWWLLCRISMRSAGFNWSRRNGPGCGLWASPAW